MNPIIRHAVVDALLTALYISFVATFMFYGSRIFGDGPETVLIPIGMLSLFVFSAAVTGSLVFGRPIMWYLDGKRKEAVTMLVYTLVSFFVIMVAVLAAYLLIR
jgi:hypothetical protein